MRRAGPLVLAILLAACGQGAQRDAGQAGAEDPPVDIGGAWRLKEAGGQPVRGGDPILITIDDTIVLKAGCVEDEWSYLAEGRKVLTFHEGRMTCLRGLSDPERKLVDTVSEGFAVIAGDAQGLHLRGMGGDVRLVPADAPWVEPPPVMVTGAPAAPPVPPGSNIPPPSPPVGSLRGDWRLAGVGGEPLSGSKGVAIHIGPDRIEFDNCQQIAWRYTLNGARITTDRTPAVTIDINPKPQPCAAKLPSQIDAMVAAIDMAERVERTEQNGVLITGPARNLSVLLFRQ